MTTYSVRYAGRGQGWYVVATDRGARTKLGTSRTVAGPYTSKEAAQKRASDENWRKS